MRVVLRPETQGRKVFLGLLFFLIALPCQAQRPPTDKHVPELAAYLDRVQIAAPVTYRHLAVYPVLLDDGKRLHHSWLTLDQAVSRGLVVVKEKDTPTVPEVLVENRSHKDYVLILQGEVLTGGKQTRTVRQDTVLAPGQQVSLSVFCVEAHRWSGGQAMSAGNVIIPHSLKAAVREGADQHRVWEDVARHSMALRVENPTGSLERALAAPPVQEKLAEVRKAIVPKMPDGTLGYIFVDRGRAVGAELFGHEELARNLFPKLIDSYAVDAIVIHQETPEAAEPAHKDHKDHRAAIAFYERICRAGSYRARTPGAGAGIRVTSGGVRGEGVSLDNILVHFGAQPGERIILPRPDPPRPIPMPRHRQESPRIAPPPHEEEVVE
jgi:hypothetical protein